jgi:hypothetical protein
VTYDQGQHTTAGKRPDSSERALLGRVATAPKLAPTPEGSPRWYRWQPGERQRVPRDDAQLPRTHERVAHVKRRGPDHDDQIIEGMEDNADGPAEPFTSALFITLSCSVQHAGDGSDIDDPSSIWPDQAFPPGASVIAVEKTEGCHVIES